MTTEKDEAAKFLLAQSVETKIRLLEESVNEDFGIFMQIANILLEAPITEGGLPSELITQIVDNS